jgi:hypothetical protein
MPPPPYPFQDTLTLQRWFVFSLKPVYLKYSNSLQRPAQLLSYLVVTQLLLCYLLSYYSVTYSTTTVLPTNTYLPSMKAAFFVLALVGTALGGLIERQTPDNDKCAADNCARAVTGTRQGFVSQASHVTDCKSFNVVTTYYGA